MPRTQIEGDQIVAGGISDLEISATAAIQISKISLNSDLLPLTNNSQSLGNAADTFENLYLKTGLILQQTGIGTNGITLKSPASVTSYSLVFPSAQATGIEVLQNDGSGNLSWVVGGGVGFREDYVVGTPLNNYTGSTTVFNLVNSYNVGGHTLLVIYDGVTMTPSATVDYVETNSTTVTFDYALVVGLKVSFIFSQPPSSTSGIVNSGTTGQIAYYASGGTTLSGANLSSISVTSITGTANEVITSASTGAVTLSLPQAIATTSSPTFSSLTLSNPLAISSGGTGKTTLSAFVPTIQKFTSSSGTYTTPAGVTWIRVRMVGGGGGGGGSGSGFGGTGGTGGNSTFGTSLLIANGGVGGTDQNPGLGGTGGTASLGSGPIGLNLSGGQGGDGGAGGVSGINYVGGNGAASAFGGSGGGGSEQAGHAASTNTGGGGGGAGATPTSIYGAGGGGSGGFIDALIVSPTTTYSYVVGAAGAAGTAGTSGFVGGAGGSGLVIVEEYYI